MSRAMRLRTVLEGCCGSARGGGSGGVVVWEMGMGKGEGSREVEEKEGAGEREGCGVRFVVLVDVRGGRSKRPLFAAHTPSYRFRSRSVTCVR